jgi:hypothetical protein
VYRLVPLRFPKGENSSSKLNIHLNQADVISVAKFVQQLSLLVAFTGAPIRDFLSSAAAVDIDVDTAAELERVSNGGTCEYNL